MKQKVELQRFHPFIYMNVVNEYDFYISQYMIVNIY